ncbi:MAG: hypothetical protein HY920_00920 [Elusimicrobia bacterium]|nr:hypothetical protein [Elusimicrobiota bacterium]
MYAYRCLVLIFIIFLGAATVLYGQPYSFYGIIEQRNIFKPLWKVNIVKPVNEENLEKKTLAEQKKIEEERRKIEEQRRLENKKTELSQNFLLSGVVFDGANTAALITDQRNGSGGSYKIGDELAGAKIISLDEKAQIVDLDYEGQFQITLKIRTIR